MATKKVYRTQAADVLECFAGHGIKATMQDCAIVTDTIAHGYAFEINGIRFQPLQTTQFGSFRVYDERS